jgi:hypothetical protein
LFFVANSVDIKEEPATESTSIPFIKLEPVELPSGVMTYKEPAVNAEIVQEKKRKNASENDVSMFSPVKFESPSGVKKRKKNRVFDERDLDIQKLLLEGMSCAVILFMLIVNF